MRITHNMMAWNANNNLKTVTGKKAKATEKVSSGYRINRAEDDAAGLAVSEKMRRLIRGLHQGSQNAMDGISWSQSGDGALNEAHDILHRMTELTINSLNGTNSESDRRALEAEFEQLQSELDKISTTTTFNENIIFEQHKIPYYQCEGDVKWDPHQMHVVTAGKNDLTFTYRTKESEQPQSVTIEIPPGNYTTQELIDEIDDLTTELNKNSDVDIMLEFDKDGYCHANLEGGEVMDSVTGNMSYLLYQMFRGGGYGALIGTTSFDTDVDAIHIVTGQNDYMKFTIQNLNGNSEEKEIRIPEGWYTRPQMIDYLNQELANTTVKATVYGKGIRLASEDAVVTGFKGNMFKIDGGVGAYDSVFYDNVKYGEVVQTSAVFIGGYVLPTNDRDEEEHGYYVIDSVNKNNHELTLQPSGFDKPVTITIDDGKYTASQMAAKLNSLFTNAGITTLTASGIYSGGFEGLKITASDKGLDSKIQIEESSGAYDTLFQNRVYNSYQVTVSPVNESKADRNAYFTGSKNWNDTATATLPLQIVAGDNDKFDINVDGAVYTITLTAGTYNSAEDIRAEIDEQLNDANALAGYKDKIEVSLTDGKIKLTGIGIDGSGNDETLLALEITGNNGYKTIFQGQQIDIIDKNQIGTGSLTLNTAFDGTIDASESQMKVTVDGTTHTINLPTGNVTKDEVINAINIPEKVTYTDNTFTEVSATGNKTDHNFTASAVDGREIITSWTNTVEGTSDKVEGSVQTTNNKPAVLKIEVALNDNMVVTDTNNQITLTINDRQEVITLENATYTKESLKNVLQQKIDAIYGTGMGGATVALDGNYLVLKAILPDGINGKRTNLTCSTDDSSFLRELNTTRTAATCTSTRALNSSIEITAVNKEFSFQYTEGGTTQNITVSLAEGVYNSRSDFVSALNTKLAGTGVTASVDSSNRLRLVSDEKGDGIKIAYGTATGGSSVEALFGPLTEDFPAKITTNCDIQSEIVITGSTDNEFNITLNGTLEKVTLDPGMYNRTEFLNMLNQKFTDAGIGVKASFNGNKLVYETIDKGPSVTLKMSYGEGGNSMMAIYGQTKNVYPGLNASIDNATGKLTLTSTDPSSQIKVNSAAGGAFQKGEEQRKDIDPSKQTGYHSVIKAYIDGVSLSGDVTIDKWNNTLKFNFKDNGTTHSCSVEVPDGTYDYNALQTILQNLIDTAVGGSGKITVTVNADGVRLEAVNPGTQNTLTNFSGDFYDKVIGKAVEESRTQSVTAKEGTQVVDSAFTVGRKDVKSNITKITGGVTDELKLDLTYGHNVYTLTMKLDEGEYTADKLRQHLQERLNEQLVLKGLHENLIEVGIGGVHTGVFGSNDDSALNFSLSKTIQAPSEGQFILDGVTGSAAFEIFYQTDGSLEQAYIVGTKDISEGLTIENGMGELSFLVDGVTYDVTIPEGSYSAEEFKDELNAQLQAGNAPLNAKIVDGKVKLIHQKMGEHEIRDVTGSAVTNVFFSENGAKKPKNDIYVKLSSAETEEERISLDKPPFNTNFMKINSICISKEKYAQKALDRLRDALEYISNVRSGFGSIQNRLEHALRNNENKEENLQASESKIRDADMAREMVAFSNFNILQQAGQAMLAQANQNNNGVLALLR